MTQNHLLRLAVLETPPDVRRDPPCRAGAARPARVRQRAGRGARGDLDPRGGRRRGPGGVQSAPPQRGHGATPKLNGLLAVPTVPLLDMMPGGSGISGPLGRRKPVTSLLR